jgi:hypothetical protein
MPLTAGRHTLCLNITKGGFYIKSLTLNRYDEDKTNITATITSVKPSLISAGDSTVITVSATSKLEDVTIDHVSVYANNLLIGTLTEAPYTLTYCPAEKGTYTIFAVATNSLGKSRTTTTKALNVSGKRVPHKGAITLPGIVQAEDFDQGGEGFTFHDSDANDEGDAKYRTDNEGLDLVKGNGGVAIGYTAKNEWTEYTVNVTQAGEYSFEATVSNGSSSNGGFTISLVKGSAITQLAKVTFSSSGGWDTYKVVSGKLSRKLVEGEQILRFTISDGNCNIDKVELQCTTPDGIEEMTLNYGQRTLYNERPTVNLAGQRVGANYRGIVIRNGKKMLVK